VLADLERAMHLHAQPARRKVQRNLTLDRGSDYARGVNNAKLETTRG
jgi:hypothetical protein